MADVVERLAHARQRHAKAQGRQSTLDAKRGALPRRRRPVL